MNQKEIDDYLDSLEDMSSDSDIKCDCPNFYSAEDHDSTCSLWDDETFINGDAVWDFVDEKLIPMDEYLDQMEPIILDPVDAPGCPCIPECYRCCKVTRAWRISEDDPWRASMTLAGKPSSPYVKTPGSKPIKIWEPKCRHFFEELSFPDDTVVYLSSSAIDSSRDDNEVPDYACYFTERRPASLALHLPWTDMGLPRVGMDVVELYVQDVLAHARAGEAVELGCIGAHGRTGTFLALLGYHAGVWEENLGVQELADHLISWVRESYCKEAIESDKQEWYVAAYIAWYNEVDWPAYVAPVVEKKKEENTEGIKIWDVATQRFVTKEETEKKVSQQGVLELIEKDEEESLTDGDDISKLSITDLIKRFFPRQKERV